MGVSGRLEEPRYTIAALAQEFGVTARAIRFYEDKGLIAPARMGQMRVYGQRDRARLSLILRGKRVGFTLAEIKEMLDLYDGAGGPEAQLSISLRKFRDRITSLRRQREDIDAAIHELEAGCDQMETLLRGRVAKAQKTLARDRP